MPNSVSVLIEKSNSLTNANVPISDTGMVIAGISVLRHVCRNRKITMMTMMIASISVCSTSRIDSDNGSRGVERDLILQSGRELF